MNIDELYTGKTDEYSQFLKEFESTTDIEDHIEWLKEFGQLDINAIVDYLYGLGSFPVYPMDQAVETNTKQRQLLETKKFVIIQHDPMCSISDKKDIVRSMKVSEEIFTGSEKRRLTFYYKRESDSVSYVDNFEFLVYFLIVKKMIENRNLLHFNAIDFVVKDGNCPKHMTPFLTDSSEELGQIEFQKRLNIFSNPIVFAGSSAQSNAFFSTPIFATNVFVKKISELSPLHVKFPMLYVPMNIENGKLTPNKSDEVQLKDGSISDYSSLYKTYNKSNPKTIEEKSILFIQSVINLDKSPLVC